MNQPAQQLVLALDFGEDDPEEEPALITDRPMSADLRIPDPDDPEGWLWLEMGSLLEGNPRYVKDPEMDARLRAEGGPARSSMDIFEEWERSQQVLREAA